MKKVLYLILALVFCLQLVGCSASPFSKDEGANTPEISGGTSESDIPVAYAMIIGLYETAVKEGWDAKKLTENGMNPMVPACIEKDERAKVGYFVGDINGDEQPELAIAAASESVYYTGLIFALYELYDGQPVLLVESNDCDRWYYAGEGRLYNEKNDSTMQSACSLCTADRELAYLDAVEYSAVDYPWLRFTGDTWKQISEEEATAAMQEMRDTVVNLEIKPFE